MGERATIRLATSDDVEVIAHFNEAMALETENKTLDPVTIRAGVQGLLNDPRRGYYLLAEIEDKVAGCLMITYEWSDWRNGLFWWIQSVYIASGFRRRGIFRQLYHHVQQQAESDPDICGLRLYVEADNQAAQRTYGSLGMKQTAYQLWEWLR